eukprot:CAMPEP_0194266804 /NCGR_PEP_ID=MMETSP0169-20130528/1586_1 /TAXON_ID=218684 /ORGANISM="Corethron pennatum, Strain L29A3" /LENGTH=138 /DNA_ID=CAMNT_0039007571 /DNA_START=408 /DNA_END=824 /DNA_ORIENTATION=-
MLFRHHIGTLPDVPGGINTSPTVDVSTHFETSFPVDDLHVKIELSVLALLRFWLPTTIYMFPRPRCESIPTLGATVEVDEGHIPIYIISIDYITAINDDKVNNTFIYLSINHIALGVPAVSASLARTSDKKGARTIPP